MNSLIPIKSINHSISNSLYSYDSYITDFNTYEYSLVNDLINIGKTITFNPQSPQYAISQSFNVETIYAKSYIDDKKIILDQYHQSKNFEFNNMRVVIEFDSSIRFLFYNTNGEIIYNVSMNGDAYPAKYIHLGNSSNSIHIGVEFVSDSNMSNKIISINPYTNDILINILNGPILIDEMRNYVYSAHMISSDQGYNLVFELYNMNTSTMNTVNTGLLYDSEYVSNVAFYHTYLELDSIKNDTNQSISRSNETNRIFSNNFIPEIIPSSKIYVFIVDDRNSGLGGDYTIFDLNTRKAVKANINVTYSYNYSINDLGEVQYYNNPEENKIIIENNTTYQFNSTKWLPFIINNTINLVSSDKFITFKKHKDSDLVFDNNIDLELHQNGFNIDPMYKLISSINYINIWNKYEDNFVKIHLDSDLPFYYSINSKFNTLLTYNHNRIDKYNIDFVFNSNDILKINPLSDSENFLLFRNKIQKYIFFLDYLGNVSKGQIKHYILLLKTKRTLAYLENGIPITVTNSKGEVFDWNYIPVNINKNNYQMIVQITILGFGNIPLETIPYSIDEYMLHNNLTYTVT